MQFSIRDLIRLITFMISPLKTTRFTMAVGPHTCMVVFQQLRTIIILIITAILVRAHTTLGYT